MSDALASPRLPLAGSIAEAGGGRRRFRLNAYWPFVIPALVVVVGVIIVFAASSGVAAYTWFICAGIGFALHYVGTAVVKNSVPTDDLPAAV